MATEDSERTAKVIKLRHLCVSRIECLKQMIEYEAALLRECDKELKDGKLG